jgi:hypothetical protein
MNVDMGDQCNTKEPDNKHLLPFLGRCLSGITQGFLSFTLDVLQPTLSQSDFRPWLRSLRASRPTTLRTDHLPLVGMFFRMKQLYRVLP